MSNRIQCADLHIDEALHALVVNEIAPGTGIDPDHFWQGVADIWTCLLYTSPSPRDRSLSRMPSSA